MSRPLRMPRAKLVFTVAAVAVLSGCASVNLEQSLSSANTTTAGFTDGKLTLARDKSEQDALRQRASDLLSKPLGQKEAVQLALVNSPSMQAIVAQSWADASTAAQSGRIANPILTLERVRLGSETEIGRLLSFGLLDLLTLPMRKGTAELRIKQAQLRLSSDVVDQVTQVRQAWVRAIAAQQTLAYTQQVFASAQASAGPTSASGFPGHIYERRSETGEGEARIYVTAGRVYIVDEAHRRGASEHASRAGQFFDSFRIH